MIQRIVNFLNPKQETVNIINGKTFKGNNISVVNGKVFVDGKLASEDTLDQKIINIQIHVNEESSLNIDSANTVQIYGSLKSLTTTNGDVTVMGNSTFVETTNGDVKFETLSENGQVKTVNGNIKYKRKL